MKAYSTDLRERAVQAVAGGTPRHEVVGLFGISLATLKRLLKQQREQGHVHPKPQPGPRFAIGEAQTAALAAQLRAGQGNDATLAQHCQQWQDEQGVAVSTATMRRALRRRGWSHKKRACEPASAMKRHARRGAKGCNR